MSMIMLSMKSQIAMKCLQQEIINFSQQLPVKMDQSSVLIQHLHSTLHITWRSMPPYISRGENFSIYITNLNIKEKNIVSPSMC